MPTFGSLFAGIGGIDLGLERAGWECRWQVEIDPFCRHVLEHHWPDVPRYGDIRGLDWNGVERVDLLAGGFPCQPFSVAGQRRGKDDERWLWPEFAAAVRALRPRHVLVENVPGLLAGHGGMGDVLGDLASLGYDAEWDSVPAAAVGAPHLRYRVWIVAHADVVGGLGVRRLFDGFRSALGYDADGRRSPLPDADSEQLWLQPAGLARRGCPPVLGVNGAFGSLADTNGSGLEGRQLQRERPDQRAVGASGVADADSVGRHGRAGERGPGWRAEPSDGSRMADAERSGRGRGTSETGWDSERRAAVVGPSAASGRSDYWLTEPDVGRVANGVPSRVDRLRALGNAVVPQVVEVIGRRLLDVERAA